MRLKYAAAVAALFALPLLVNLSMAASTADFQGKYDLLYTNAFTDLTIVIVAPGHEALTINLDVNEALINEQLPMASVDPVIAQVAEALVQYRPEMRDQIYDAIMNGVSNGLYSLVDSINESAKVLPDTMDVKVVNTRTGLADATFLDLDNQDSESTVLRGAVTLSGTQGLFSFVPIFEGVADSAAGYKGQGSYVVNGIQVEEVVHGVKISVSGDVQLDMNLTRL